MSFNYSKLKGRIKEKYSTQEEFSKVMGMSRTSVSLRLCGKLEFSQKEIDLAIKVLDLVEQDIPEYFFTKEV